MLHWLGLLESRCVRPSQSGPQKFKARKIVLRIFVEELTHADCDIVVP
jgi:hypothetical protein